MFTRFKTETTTLFVDPKSSATLKYEEGAKLDIILSPSLYWVKKLSLPVTSLREVKKLLPSIFEDSIPEAHYSYTAYKSGDEFIAFAYEDKKIIELLKDLGINYADINSVRFAQSEFEAVQNAQCINETQCMYVKDSLVLLAPTLWIKESQPLNLQNITLSKHTIHLQQFGHIVDNSSLYKIGAILTTLALILVVEIFVTSSKKDAILESKDALFSKYHLQATMFQNNASMKKYTKIYKTQTRLREYISYFLSMKLKPSQKITLIEFRAKKLYVSFSGVSKGSERRLTSQLGSKKVKYALSFNGNTMKVEMKI